MKYFFYFCLFSAVFSASLLAPAYSKQDKIRIGSRDFPESVLVAEILSTSIEKFTDYKVDRKFHLGGVKVCLAAMQSNNLDIYPDYTGSLIHNVLGEHDRNQYLVNYIKMALNEKYDFSITESLGFENSFVLAVRKSFAKKYNLETLSDLASLLSSNKELAQNIRVAFKHSFLKRPDGYKMLQDIYAFDFQKLMALEYNIAYQNLKENRIDVIDAFSTDSRLKDPELTALKDDRNALIPYSSVYVYRNKLKQNFPEIMKIQKLLDESLTNEKMLELNSRIEAGEPYKQVAESFIAELEHEPGFLDLSDDASLSFWQKRLKQDLPLLAKAFLQHLRLAAVASLLASFIGIFIGIFISYRKKLAKLVLGFISVTQTIPSLALLALLIPFVGLGFYPAVIALFIYALLPVIQNTYTGITTIPYKYIELANAIALKESQILFRVKLPMALSFILAGVRTSIVICIGTATLATFVGAGGLGDLIKAGIDLNSNYMIALGAVPAALLALSVSITLTKFERRFYSRIG